MYAVTVRAVTLSLLQHSGHQPEKQKATATTAPLWLGETLLDRKKTFLIYEFDLTSTVCFISKTREVERKVAKIN